MIVVERCQPTRFDQKIEALSIPLTRFFLRGRAHGLPQLGSADAGDVDAVEEHREPGRVHLDSGAVAAERRKAKAATLEALVVKDEPATIEEENLAPIEATADEDEEMACIEGISPLAKDEGREAIVAAPEIDRLGGEVDPDARRQRQHARRACTTAAMYPGEMPSSNSKRSSLTRRLHRNADEAPVIRTGKRRDSAGRGGSRRSRRTQ